MEINMKGYDLKSFQDKDIYTWDEILSTIEELEDKIEELEETIKEKSYINDYPDEERDREYEMGIL